MHIKHEYFRTQQKTLVRNKNLRLVTIFKNKTEFHLEPWIFQGEVAHDGRYLKKKAYISEKEWYLPRKRASNLPKQEEIKFKYILSYGLNARCWRVFLGSPPGFAVCVCSHVLTESSYTKPIESQLFPKLGMATSDPPIWN